MLQGSSPFFKRGNRSLPAVRSSGRGDLFCFWILNFVFLRFSFFNPPAFGHLLFKGGCASNNSCATSGSVPRPPLKKGEPKGGFNLVIGHWILIVGIFFFQSSGLRPPPSPRRTRFIQHRIRFAARPPFQKGEPKGDLIWLLEFDYWNFPPSILRPLATSFTKEDSFRTVPETLQGSSPFFKGGTKGGFDLVIEHWILIVGIFFFQSSGRWPPPFQRRTCFEQHRNCFLSRIRTSAPVLSRLSI